jgi:hypothetical protein
VRCPRDEFEVTLTLDRFVKNEQWRKEFGTDDLVRTFDYKERPQMFEYYPQYYHKTDKVSMSNQDQMMDD